MFQVYSINGLLAGILLISAVTLLLDYCVGPTSAYTLVCLGHTKIMFSAVCYTIPTGYVFVKAARKWGLYALAKLIWALLLVDMTAYAFTGHPYFNLFNLPKQWFYALLAILWPLAFHAMSRWAKIHYLLRLIRESFDRWWILVWQELSEDEILVPFPDSTPLSAAERDERKRQRKERQP
ncbi:hypothetical protein NX059_012398 [Plenodomus lindquistii]|nr:hypothetical protein NX059_012398 [Plenodomus lindquistii]